MDGIIRNSGSGLVDSLHNWHLGDDRIVRAHVGPFIGVDSNIVDGEGEAATSVDVVADDDHHGDHPHHCLQEQRREY